MSADPAVLRKAADVIRRGGLCDGALEANGAHCTVGAVLAARGVNLDMVVGEDILAAEREIDTLADLLGGPGDFRPANLPAGWPTVVTWNDTDGRTAADVITLLEQAAEKAEASEVLTP